MASTASPCLRTPEASEVHALGDTEGRSSNEFIDSTLSISCRNCRHYNKRLPLKFPRDQSKHTRPQCERCGFILLGLGRSSTQTTLASGDSIPLTDPRVHRRASVRVCGDQSTLPLLDASSRPEHVESLPPLNEHQDIMGRSRSTSNVGRNSAVFGMHPPMSLLQGTHRSPPLSGEANLQPKSRTDILSRGHQGKGHSGHGPFGTLRGMFRRRLCGPKEFRVRGYRFMLQVETPHSMGGPSMVHSRLPQDISEPNTFHAAALDTAQDKASSTKNEDNSPAGAAATPKRAALVQSTALKSLDGSLKAADHSSPSDGRKDQPIDDPSSKKERLRIARRQKTIEREAMTTIECKCTDDCPRCGREKPTASDVPPYSGRSDSQASANGESDTHPSDNLWILSTNQDNSSDSRHSQGSGRHLVNHTGEQFVPYQVSSSADQSSSAELSSQRHSLSPVPTHAQDCVEAPHTIDREHGGRSNNEQNLGPPIAQPASSIILENLPTAQGDPHTLDGSSTPPPGLQNGHTSQRGSQQVTPTQSDTTHLDGITPTPSRPSGIPITSLQPSQAEPAMLLTALENVVDLEAADE